MRRHLERAQVSGKVARVVRFVGGEGDAPPVGHGGDHLARGVPFAVPVRGGDGGVDHRPDRYSIRTWPIYPSRAACPRAFLYSRASVSALT